MCRLTLLTTTPDKEINPTMKELIMHLTMIYSVADDNQQFGSGVSDGLTTKKSGRPYVEYGQSWLHNLNPDRIWLGHVRKPSVGTDMRSALAAHPYDFRNGQSPFVMAHNGGIEPALSDVGVDPQAPNTDTYRAGIMLQEQLGGRRITRGAITDWLGNFDVRTSSSFLFLQNDQAIVVRGERPLFVMKLGNGYLINTSNVVLSGVRNTLIGFFRMKIDAPVLMPEYSYMRLAPAMHIPRPIAIRVKYKPAPAMLMYVRNLVRFLSDEGEPEDPMRNIPVS